MELHPTQSDDGAESEQLASLLHSHRNLIQNMHSLVGLTGRSVPAGRCRDAFTDLRARFEALTEVSHETPRNDIIVEIDLGALVGRLLELLDPTRLHQVTVAASPVRVAARRVAAIRQMIGEMTIALFRQGLQNGGGGDVMIKHGEDGDIAVRLSAREPSRTSEDGADHNRSWSIAHELARFLDAAIETSSTQPFVVEARIPAIDSGR